MHAYLFHRGGRVSSPIHFRYIIHLTLTITTKPSSYARGNTVSAVTFSTPPPPVCASGLFDGRDGQPFPFGTGNHG